MQVTFQIVHTTSIANDISEAARFFTLFIDIPGVLIVIGEVLSVCCCAEFVPLSDLSSIKYSLTSSGRLFRWFLTNPKNERTI